MEGHTCALLNTSEESHWTKRLGLDERRRLDELPENYEDLTSQPGPSPPAEVPTEPAREPEEPSHEDLDDGMGTGGHVIPPEESGATVS